MATATPRCSGSHAASLDELRAYLESTGSNCMAVVKDGRLVEEAYWNGTDEDTDQEIWSASKSVTSALVGIASDQGHLDVDEKASVYLDEWRGTPSEDVTIRNLLSNDSGRYYDFETDYLRMTTSEDRSTFAIDLDQQHDPGTHWEYNNSAIQTLEEILERATGQDVGEFAQENLFDPIGMSSTISRDQAGNPATFMGTQAGCRDMARFGYLFLRDGAWDGEQIVSSDYVAEATSPSQDLNRAYGYLWWLNADGGWLAPAVGTEQQDGLFWPDAPDDAFAALGLGNQIILVLPSHDMVVVRAGPWESDDRVELQDTSVSEMGRLAAQATGG
ncbi:MAG: serine hydrolase [Acidimicrobiia bacterium]|nr:serine hydrolase [Acidimicrobiia bacterium]